MIYVCTRMYSKCLRKSACARAHVHGRVCGFCVLSIMFTLQIIRPATNEYVSCKSLN